jgi:hypothetical protein
MRHLRSAIAVVRRGHKGWWGDTHYGTEQHEKLSATQPLKCVRAGEPCTQRMLCSCCLRPFPLAPPLSPLPSLPPSLRTASWRGAG